jgi:hypothetical protein
MIRIALKMFAVLVKTATAFVTSLVDRRAYDRLTGDEKTAVVDALWIFARVPYIHRNEAVQFVKSYTRLRCLRRHVAKLGRAADLREVFQMAMSTPDEAPADADARLTNRP